MSVGKIVYMKLENVNEETMDQALHLIAEQIAAMPPGVLPEPAHKTCDGENARDEKRVATESEQGRCGVEAATETEPPNRETIKPPRETKPSPRETPEPCDDFAARLEQLLPSVGDELISVEHFLGSDLPALKVFCERSQGKYKFINASRWSRSKVARFAPDAAQQAAPVTAPSAIAGGASDTVITSTLLKAARRVGEVAALKQVFLTPETRKRARELARIDRRFELTGGGENVRRVAE